MKKFFFLTLIFFTSLSFAQLKDIIIDGNQSKQLQLRETNAEYPDGPNAFKNLILKNFRMKKVKGQGKNHSDLTFVIDKEGNITNIEATGDNESFNKEAVRAASRIKNKWIPATINGEKVRSRFRLPLHITYK